MYSSESPPLKRVYPEHDDDADERTSSNRVYRLKPARPYRSSGSKNTQFASDRPSITGRITRALGRFSVAVLVGIGVTLAWQSYSGEMIRTWAPSLGWLLTASPSAELQALIKPVALDLAIIKRSVEQLASNQDQFARKLDQMTQAFATLQAAEQDINQNILALAPLAPKAGHVTPPKPTQSSAQ